MKIFVTGSRGFVGFHLLKQLKKKKHRIIGCDVYDCDVTNFPDLMRSMEGDVVIHLAARVRAGQSLKRPYQYIQTNVMGTLNVLEVMRLKGIPRIVFISSLGVKSFQKDAPYLWSKQMGELLVEMYCKHYGIESVIIRPSNIYGKGNHKGILYLFTKAKKEGKTLQIFGDGLQSRDFIYIDDLVGAVVKAVKVKMPSKSPLYIEAGTGVETSVLELAKKIAPKSYVLVPTGEVGISQSVADTTNGEKYLKWKAKVSLDEGLRRMMEEE